MQQEVSATPISIILLSLLLADEIPVVSVGTKDRISSEGISIMFDCLVDSEATLLWKHEDVMLYPSRRHNLYSNGSLVINPVQLSDEGGYTCMAVNKQGGSAQSQISLQVRPLLCKRVFIVH